MRFNLLMVVLLVAVTLSLAQNRAKKNRCTSNGGNCVAKSRVGKKCERLPFTCPKKSICCKKKHNSIAKRKCRVRTDCLKVNGTCISAKSNTCTSTVQDDLCKGASCTCCPNSLTKPICKTKKICSKKGGYCMPMWESSKCDGTHDKSLCKGRYCTCCISATDSDCSCGQANTRIVGGEEVSLAYKYPWMVGIVIQYHTPGYWCWGTIINRRYVLTAAHCFYYDPENPNPENPNPEKPMEPKEIKIGIADHQQFSTDEDIARVTEFVEVESLIIHENYDSNDDPHDIGLLKLKVPLDLTANDEIKPVCLPSDVSKTYEGYDAIVAGWGKQDYYDDTSAPNILNEVTVRVLSPNCGDFLYDIDNTAGMLCAGYTEGGKDSCSGDSGGPLVVSENGSYTLIGIVSFGDGCANPNAPGVYTRVTEYLDWIASNTKDGSYCSD